MELRFIDQDKNILVTNNFVNILSIPKNVYSIVLDKLDDEHVRFALNDNDTENILDFYFSDVLDPITSDASELIEVLSGLNFINTQFSKTAPPLLSLDFSDQVYNFIGNYADYNTATVQFYGTMSGLGQLLCQFQQSIDGVNWTNIVDGYVEISAGELPLVFSFPFQAAYLRLSVETSGSLMGKFNVAMLVKK